MLKFIVKGNKKTSLSHCTKNGLTDITFISYSQKNNESVLSIHDNEENNNLISKWFINPDYGINAPFKIGSVLYYFWDR